MSSGVAETGATGKGRAVVLPGSRHGWSLPALPRNLPAPVLQGSRVEGTRRGGSLLRFLAFV